MFKIGDEVFPIYGAGYNRDWYSNETDWFVYCRDDTYEIREEYDGYTVQNYRTYSDGKTEYFVGYHWFFGDNIYPTYKEALAETKLRNKNN